MAYVKHIKENFGQAPLFLPIVQITSIHETMEQLEDRADLFRQFTPAWKRYDKK